MYHKNRKDDSMEKLQYDKTLKKMYVCKKRQPFILDVPQMKYLCFDGMGHPSDDDFQRACDALYTLSYTIKFEIARRRFDMDYKVNPMEVTWHLDKGKEETRFTWTMMIRQPDFVTEEIFVEAVDIARKKGKKIAGSRVEFKEVDFGKCVQCFHLGDYNKMNDTLAKMHEFAAKNGYAYDQYTHDIYLNDMRKTKAENYQTIMRVKIYDQ